MWAGRGCSAGQGAAIAVLKLEAAHASAWLCAAVACWAEARASAAGAAGDRSMQLYYVQGLGGLEISAWRLQALLRPGDSALLAPAMGPDAVPAGSRVSSCKHVCCSAALSSSLIRVLPSRGVKNDRWNRQRSPSKVAQVASPPCIKGVADPGTRARLQAQSMPQCCSWLGAQLSMVWAYLGILVVPMHAHACPRASWVAFVE